MTRRALVVGASGALGEAVARALCERGWTVRAGMRTQREDVRARLTALGADIVALDLAAPVALSTLAQDCHSVVFTTHLALVTPVLPLLSATPQVLAFSSNNISVDADAPTYRALTAHEVTLRRQSASAIIVRPTLIYGDPRLLTVTRLLRLAQRAPILPLPGSGRALVQPVFVDDLGAMAAVLLETPAAAGRTYAVGGPDIVSMHALYAAIRDAARSRALITPIPRWVIRLGRSVLGERFPLTNEQCKRVNADRRADSHFAADATLTPRTPIKEGLAKLVSRMEAR